MKKPDMNKLITRSLIVILCLFFVVGVAWGAESILDMEGTAKPYEKAEPMSPYPETQDDIIAYVNMAIDKAVAEAPKLSSSDDCEIESDSVTADGTDALKTLGDYITGSLSGDSKNLEKAIEESATELSFNFGEGFAGHIKSLVIDQNDVLSAECKYDYYVCPVCGEDYNEPVEECEECDSKVAMLLRYRDDYTITVKLKDGSKSVESVYSLRTPQECAAIAQDKLDNICTLGEVGLNRINPVIVINVNRLTDKINRIDYKMDTEVSAPLSFTGMYEYLGLVNTGFTVSERYRLDFTWPGLSLSEHTLSMQQGTTEVLKATLTCEDPLKETVRWSISDDSLATIDDEGYIKAGKTDGVFDVTAQYDYLGVTYSDTCTVYIRTSVESVDLVNRSVALKVGGSETLEAKISPKKATVQTVTWHSEDESIAVVDANGTITAVGEGTVNVYALTDDGWYKATCKVEVTK